MFFAFAVLTFLLTLELPKWSKFVIFVGNFTDIKCSFKNLNDFSKNVQIEARAIYCVLQSFSISLALMLLMEIFFIFLAFSRRST